LPRRIRSLTEALDTTTATVTLQAATAAAEQINAALGPDAFDGDALARIVATADRPLEANKQAPIAIGV
jgi:hypothetical protein